MNRISLLLLVLAILACNSNSDRLGEEDYSSPNFHIIDDIKPNFIEVPFGRVHAITYTHTGRIVNKSKTIVKGAVLEMRIILKLENGNIVTNEDIDGTPMLIPSYKEFLHGQFMPETEQEFKLESPRMRYEYFDYPVKSVWVQYELSGADPINNMAKVGGIILQKNITALWMDEKERIKKL